MVLSYHCCCDTVALLTPRRRLTLRIVLLQRHDTECHCLLHARSARWCAVARYRCVVDVAVTVMMMIPPPNSSSSCTIVLKPKAATAASSSCLLLLVALLTMLCGQ